MEIDGVAAIVSFGALGDQDSEIDEALSVLRGR